MTQDEQTDWEHAMERARDAGLEIWVRQDTFFCDYPPKPTNPVLTLKNKDDFNLKNDFDFFFCFYLENDEHNFLKMNCADIYRTILI